MKDISTVSCADLAAHTTWVRFQARTVARNLPANIEVDDLYQAGMIALAEALTSYAGADGDVDALRRFAYRRVRGGMIDQLRALDPLTRSERAAVRAGRVAGPVAVDIDDYEPATEPGALDDLIHERQAAKRLAVALDQIVDSDREILAAYLGDNESTLASVAAARGISATRISQKLSAITARLRALVQHRTPLAQPALPQAAPSGPILKVMAEERWG